jgi:lipooligosaccharide transport system permease protein
MFGYLLASTRPYFKIAALSQLGSPMLYLLSLGIGLGSIVNARSGAQSLGTSYLSFLAPALIAATALQVAVGEATYPILFSGFKFQRIYFAMNATPLTARQIASGVLSWIAARAAFSATLYLVVVACFGGVRSVGALLCVPIATLGAMALAAPIAVYSSTVEIERGGFAAIFRFLVMPMFLFSGTFYPVSALPEWGQALAWLSPLWHATELARWASLGSLHLGSGVGQVGPAALLGHVAFLTALTVAGVLLTGWRFRVRLAR